MQSKDLRFVADYNYNLGNPTLEVLQVHKDLGVLVSYDLKSYNDCHKNAFRANLALVKLKRIFGQSDGKKFHPHLQQFYSMSLRIR